MSLLNDYKFVVTMKISSFDDMESSHLYISDQISNIPSNKPNDFIVQLNRTLELNENSTIEVLNCSYDCVGSPSGELRFIFSDVVENSYFHGSEQPVIGVVLPAYKKFERHYFNNPSKHKTIVGKIKRFRIYIRKRKISDTSFDFRKLRLTLRFSNVRVK